MRQRLDHPQAIAAILFAVAVAIYSCTLVRAHIYADDSIRWAIDVESGNLLHQHHVAYLFVGHLFYEALRTLAAGTSALLALQLLSAWCGALGLAWFYLLLRRLRADARAASVSTVALGATFGYWGYAVTADVYIPTTAALIAAALLLVRTLQEGPSWWNSFGLVVAMVAAIVLHQASVLFYPVAMLGLAVAPAVRKRRLWHALAVTFAAGGTVLGGYALLYWRTQAAPSSGGFVAFLLGYLIEMPTLPGDSGLSRSTLPRAFMGFSQAVFNANFLFSWEAIYDKAQAALPAKYLADDRFLVRQLGMVSRTVIVAAALLLPLTAGAMLLRQARQLRQHTRSRTFVVLAAWFVLQALFFTWWEAGSNEFWISSLVPLVACFHLLAHPPEGDQRRASWPGCCAPLWPSATSSAPSGPA